MNNVCLIGRLVRDVELRYTPNNTAVAHFTIAVDKKFKKEGEQTANFIPVVVWGKTAEFASNYFSKGTRIGVTGELQTRTWKDKEDKSHFVVEVVAEAVYFADGKSNPSSGKQTFSEDEEFEL